ncbi:MAG: PH domain-containing protein [Pseudomonadota bacterium]
MSSSLILNEDNNPFGDERSAKQVAAALTKEIGGVYIATQYQDGYAVVNTSGNTIDTTIKNEKSIADEVFIKPVLRSQLTKVIKIILGFSIILFAESILIFMYLDSLQVLLFELINKTFDWNIAINVFRGIVFVYCLIQIIHLFIIITSKNYYIGPYGLESSSVFFDKDGDRAEFRHVSKVKAHQTPLQRLFRYGRVDIYTSASDGVDFSFENIANPFKVREIIKKRLIKV